MEETAVNESNTRTRVKLSLTAKGTIQWEATCEYDTPEKSIEEMGKTVDMIRTLLKEKNLVEAGTNG